METTLQFIDGQWGGLRRHIKDLHDVMKTEECHQRCQTYVSVVSVGQEEFENNRSLNHAPRLEAPKAAGHQ
jgi:hypothetical protein